MRLLLFIVGVGAGNSTRAQAVIGALRRLAPDLDLHIAAQGRAADLLADIGPIHPMRRVTYAAEGAFSAWNIVASNLAFPWRFAQNRAAAKRLIRQLQPDLIVADSDFYCLGPARRAAAPLASINSSPATVAALQRLGIPRGCGFSGRVIERLDAWLQRRHPDRVICPVLEREKGLASKVIQIPPIVRPECVPSEETSEEIVVVTGGSGIGTHDMDLRGVEAPLVTLGARIERVPPHAEQCGFTLEAVTRMRRAKVLVVQGGFSSVSEAVALRRPTVVVPITGHAEQWINARLFEELGLGLSAPGPEAGARVNEVLARHAASAARRRAGTVGTARGEPAPRELHAMAHHQPLD